MGDPAAVMGDLVTGTCLVHEIPNPASGAPQPTGPLPFSAPLLQSLATKTLVGGKPAAVVGSSGTNTPVHPLPLIDPFVVPQMATVISGSATVLIENQPAATLSSAATICAGASGQVAATGATVLVGG